MNNRFFYSLILLIFTCMLFSIASCSFLKRSKGEVTIIKQWHFAPGVDTTDVEKFKNDPRFTNQLDIYKYATELLTTVPIPKSSLVIAEGCKGKIDESFVKSFNGWNMSKLQTWREHEDFASIMAPVAMKIKTMYPKVDVECGDDEELIKKHLLAFSDLNGLIGIHTRLSQSHGDKFTKYHQLLEKIVGKKIESPLDVSKDMAREAWSRVIQYTHARNNVFIKKIKKNLFKNPVVIIGGVHVEDIVKKLQKESIPVKVITPIGYHDESSKLMATVENFLKVRVPSIVLNQIPEQLKIADFPLNHQIRPDQIAGIKEWQDLKELSEKVQLPLEILSSDFDQDGIRDFTLSRGNGKMYLTAEDPDWDNDGIINLLDNTLGDLHIPINASINVSNVFDVRPASIDDELSTIKNHDIELLSGSDQSHDILVLKIFAKVLNNFSESRGQVKLFLATDQKLKYGENVFFSFIRHTQTLEFYPQSFYSYIQSKRNEFNGVNDKDFILKIVTPIIIHSLAHELAHSLKLPTDKFLYDYGWAWQSKIISSKYLKSYRHPSKIMNRQLLNFSYRGRDAKKWNALYQDYLEVRKQQQKSKKILPSPWSTGLKFRDLEHSFFATEKIPSLYSLSAPYEWYAEMVAGCIWQRLFGIEQSKLKRVEASSRYELLIGFNPFAADLNFCAESLNNYNES